MKKLSASITAIKNFPDKIIEGCLSAVEGGANLIHFDVVGGAGKQTKIIEEGSEDTISFFNPELLKQIKKQNPSLLADIHIMEFEPKKEFIQKWIDAKADYIAIHWESFIDKEKLLSILSFIKSQGANPGLSIKPDADIAKISKFLTENPDLVKLVSQCGVYPCLGGQKMFTHIFKNVQRLDKLRKENNLDYEIMVDAGVKPGLLSHKCYEAGADILVAGSAFFKGSNFDLLELKNRALNIKEPVLPKFSEISSIIAEKISKIREQKKGKIWILVEGYHGSGKTYLSTELEQRLIFLGLQPTIIPLDFSWTDRQKRANWKIEAYNSSKEHNYFHSLKQEPEPAHWRQEHSRQAIKQIEKTNGKLVVENCYQFNEIGDTNGRFMNYINDDSILIVEGVYGSLAKEDWDLRIYISCDRELSKQRAMIRDEIKVFRPKPDTRALYEDVYEKSYDEYLKLAKPIDKANIVIEFLGKEGETYQRIKTAKPFLAMLQCSNPECLRQYYSTREDKCRVCGKDLVNAVIGEVDFMDSIIKEDKTMWRYANFFPVNQKFIVSSTEGNTPIVYLKETSKKLGVNLWFKLENVNPTGTFKDREASYVVSLSKQYGQENLVMQSTGNTAMAVTHYSGLANIPSWCFIPESSSYKLWTLPKKQRNHLIAVKGHPIDVKNVAEKFAEHFSFPKISPFYERCEANATLGYEVGEALLNKSIPENELLGEEGFDYYVQSISAGMGAIGFFHAMKRLQGWTKGKVKLPKILGVEISEFAPIHQAMEQDLEQVGDEVATPYFPEHELFEPTLWTTNIRKYYPHLRMIIKESKGMFSMVTPEEVKETVKKYGVLTELESMGYEFSKTENASFIGFTGMVKKIESGEIPKQSNIIIMLTGKGFHDEFVKLKPDLIVDPQKDSPQSIVIKFLN